jgi:hypothetical protein
MSIGPSTRYVKDLVSDYVSGELQDPDYQREYVWSEKQAKHFLSRTLGLGHVLGVITTYRIANGNTSFLQDGKQRLTTLQRAIDRPAEYGLSKDNADRLKNSQVSQQSMIYESHDEARLDFQHLNSGIGLIPFEKYRGDLECDDIGRFLYQRIRQTVHDLSISLAGISRSTAHARKKAGQLHRSSLGLFYQYATGHKEMQLYAKSERSINDQIERRVRAWLDQNIDNWESTAENFIRELERINAVLNHATKPHQLKRWDLTSVRAMYAAKIYCRNMKCPSDVFANLVDWYVQQNVSRKSWSARFEVMVADTPTPVRLDQNSLKWLRKVAEVGGPEVCERKRVKNYNAPAGYDESHVVPHADGGTETFVEPAIPNRARQRQVVENTN